MTVNPGYVDGQWRDVQALPHHMRRLHHKIARAARQDREQRIEQATDPECRRWPGLANPTSKEQ